MADPQPFEAFAFEPKGAPPEGRRPMPERLNDIVNVKDRGVRGDNSTDDRVKFQACIDYLINRPVNPGGTIFVPEGIYKISPPGLSCGHDSNPNIGIKFLGAGKHGTFVDIFNSASFYSPVLSKGSHKYDCIERIESMGFASSVLTRPNVSVISSYGQVDASRADTALIQNCGASAGYKIGASEGDQFTAYMPDGCFCFAVGNNGTISCCRSNGFGDVCFALSGDNPTLINSSCEVGNYGCKVGWAPGVGEVPTRGALVIALQTEQAQVGMEIINLDGGFIASNVHNGTVGAAALETINSATWSGGTVTAHTLVPHNLAVGTHTIQLRVKNAYEGGNVEDESWKTTETFYNVKVSPGEPSTFRYALAVNPSKPYHGTMQWTWPLRNAVRIKKMSNTTLIAGTTQHVSTHGNFDLDYDGASELINNTFIGVQASKAGWFMPTARKNLAGNHFVSCGNFAIEVAIAAANGSIASPNGQMNFADLPGQAGVLQYGPFEGQEFDIKDGAKSGGGAALFDNTVQGGGSGHYRVRYGGSPLAWRRIG